MVVTSRVYICVPFLFQSTFITCLIKLPSFMPETAVSCAWLKIKYPPNMFFFRLRFSWTVFGAELAAPLGRWWRRAFFVSAGVFSEIPRDVPESWSVGDQLQALMLLGNHWNFPWEFPRKDPCESTVRRGFEWCVYLYVKKNSLEKNWGSLGS